MFLLDKFFWFRYFKRLMFHSNVWKLRFKKKGIFHANKNNSSELIMGDVWPNRCVMYSYYYYF